ncbi:hypothetical protein V7S43_009215 [Phytophthora oleae]|uniref:Uncharacterized protein n=1 Tax=Phytophthora oleae TaxID=2107226 RepID=A0ABD3FJ89_9STRA
MLHTADLDSVRKIAANYPVCYDKAYMLGKPPTVLQRPMASVITDPNFVIPRKLLQHVNNGLLEYVKAREKDKDCELVNTGPDDDVAAAYVVAEMGGFSM